MACDHHKRRQHDADSNALIGALTSADLASQRNPAENL
jgi:hypothetical protein